MKPLQITVVGQVSVQMLSLDPFISFPVWNLPSDFSEQNLKLAIETPWQDDGPIHADFLQALKNLILLSQSISFPSFSITSPI